MQRPGVDVNKERCLTVALVITLLLGAILILSGQAFNFWEFVHGFFA